MGGFAVVVEPLDEVVGFFSNSNSATAAPTTAVPMRTFFVLSFGIMFQAFAVAGVFNHS